MHKAAIGNDLSLLQIPFSCGNAGPLDRCTDGQYYYDNNAVLKSCKCKYNFSMKKSNNFAVCSWILI